MDDRRKRARTTACFNIEWLETRRLLSSVSWSAATGGSWNTPGNWSGGAVPAAGDDVVISKPGNIQITESGGTAINSLTITGDTLNISGGTLAIAGAAAINSSSSVLLATGSAGSGVGTNLIGNPGFESPSTSNSTTVPDVWGQWNSAYVSSAYHHGGSQSLVESGSDSGAYQTFSASPGVSYSASIYSLNPATTGLTGSEGAYMHIVFYNTSGGQIASPTDWVQLVSSASTPGVWTHSTATIVAPAGAATVELFLQIGPYTGLSGTSGGSAYMDDVQFGPTAFSTSSLTAGSLSNSGSITIGAGDTITAGAFTESATGSLITQLGGPAAGGFYGSLNSSSAATLAGSFKATLVNSYSPSISDGFNLINYPSETGVFSSYQLPSGSTYSFAAATNPTYFGISAVPVNLSTNINAGAVVASSTNNLVGVNLAYWDDVLTTAQTQQMVEAAGLSLFRFPGGSASDDFHFNVADNYDDSAANTIPEFAKFITSVGGTGIVTTDYGSGSPQEAEAELAYLEGSTTDTTSIGNGPEWNDSSGAWQTVNWQTVGYWASLRAAQPLANNDGLNFLRIGQAAPFTNINYWEIGNEEYGDWEVDHHSAQHDPSTYAAFAAAFAAFDSADSLLPKVSIGVDSGDPTGASDGNWTRNVVTDLYADGYVPGFISDHSYMYGPGDENDSLLLNGTVSNTGSIDDWSIRYADYESMLQAVLGSKASTVKVMATEFNSNYGTEGKQMTSLVNGLFVADSIGSLLDSGYVGGLVWDLRNGWNTTGNNSNSLYGWREGGDEGILGASSYTDAPSTGPYIPYPTYFGEQLASKIMEAGGEAVSTLGSYNELTVYSVLESDGQLELMVLNKNPDASLTNQFNISGFSPNGQAQVWQYGESQDYAQSQSATGASALASFNTSLTLSGNNFSYSFPAYSMTVLDLFPVIASQSGSALLIKLNSAAPIAISSSSNTITVAQNGNANSFTGVTSIAVTGSATSDVLNLNGAASAAFTFTGTGTTTLNINSPTMTIAAGSGSTFNNQSFAAVNIASGAKLSLAAPLSQAGRTLLDVQTLFIAGSTGHWTGLLDLNANDLEVQEGSLATINDQVKQGWTFGTGGIVSSAAVANPTHLTTLGTILNTIDGTPSGSALFNTGKPFDGTAPPASAILVKYTYYGDTNLDGKVDGSDYARIDANYHGTSTGWFNGDFNYDGNINGTDYTLIDNAFNSQGTSLAGMIGNVSAKPAAEAAVPPYPGTGPFPWVQWGSQTITPDLFDRSKRAALIDELLV